MHLVSGVGLLRPDGGTYLELVLEDRTVFLYRAIDRRKETENQSGGKEGSC